MSLRSRFGFALIAALFACSQQAHAVTGEMGTGVPTFGQYATSLGGHVTIYGISNATTPFPSGCTALYLYPSVMGADPYKVAVALLIAAKTSGMAVRFYAHADNGCAVDYVQLMG
jgi:hypothetical protein